MSQRQQLERLLQIDGQIRARQYPNAHSLAADLEVSPRVIYEDRVFMINRLGAPITYNRARRGWYYTHETYLLPTAMVTQSELLAFLLSVEVARRHLGTALELPLRSAVEKLSHSVQGAVAVDLETLRTHYTFATFAAAATDERTLLALHDAIQQARQVRIHYYTASRNERTRRTVHPYHLHLAHGDWYLFAYDDYRRAIRTFHAGRIEEFEVLPGGFTRDPDFNVGDYIQTQFQVEASAEIMAIMICFDATEAPYIRERHWHDSQQIEEQAHGGLILRMQTSGLGALKRWVMGYGQHAEVLAPPELRAAVQEEARGLKKLYGL